MPERLPKLAMEEFLSWEFDSLYTIDPILPVGGVALLHGKGGHGKTQLALTIVDAITQGGLLFNRYRAREGKVVFFQFDMTPELFQERLRQAEKGLGRPDRLVLSPYGEPIDLLDEDWQEEVAEIVAEEEPELVVFDTLRKLHPHEENDNSLPSRVYGIVKRVCQGASALILHHDRKAPAGGDGEDAAESFRGARAWVDDADLGMRVRKRATGQIMLDWSKWRCEDPDALFLWMDPETLLLEERAPLTAREHAISIMQGSPGISREELVARTAEAAGVTRRAVNLMMQRAGESLFSQFS